MHIYTSNFSKNCKNENAISIARKTPAWANCRRYIKLAPSYSLLMDYKKGRVNKEQYKEIYKKETLDKLDPIEIMNELGDGAILLCYEKSSDFCHRHIVAQWLMANTNIIVEEI